MRCFFCICMAHANPSIEGFAQFRSFGRGVEWEVAYSIAFGYLAIDGWGRLVNFLTTCIYPAVRKLTSLLLEN